MSGDQFKRALERVGLNVNAAAPFLGISLRQLRRIAAGDYQAPEAVRKLLKLMARDKLQAQDWNL
jgi:hypothetical protein